MSLPSPTRLEQLLAPYAGSSGVPVRVWGTDAGSAIPHMTMERAIFDSAPPRLLCLGAGPEGLVVVRQTRDHLEDLDGVHIPWEQVRAVDRDPHLVRDVLTVEIAGRPPLRIGVSNHILMPGNRSAAKALCDMAHRPTPESSSIVLPRAAPRVDPPVPRT